MKIPIQVKISLIGFLIMTGEGVLLILLFTCIIQKFYGPFIGAILYSTFILIQRHLHTKSFHKGIKLLKTGNAKDAITCFETSLAHFEKHPQLDHYRYWIGISCSNISCREMSIRNLAVCYLLLRNHEKSTFYYQTLVTINIQWEYTFPLLDKLLDKSIPQ